MNHFCATDIYQNTPVPSGFDLMRIVTVFCFTAHPTDCEVTNANILVNEGVANVVKCDIGSCTQSASMGLRS